MDFASYKSPADELIAGLKKRYANGEFADVTVVCHENTYHVHKVVICSLPSFFDKVCNIGMKEAFENKIELPDDEPHIMDKMMEYFYGFDYSMDADEATNCQATLSKQQISDLQIEGSLYCDECGTYLCDPEHNVACHSEIYNAAERLLTHSKVYALADKYYIKGLKELAAKKFEQACLSVQSPMQMLEAAEHAYQSTLEDDRGIRDIVVKTMSTFRGAFEDEEMENFLPNMGSLCYDLLVYGAKKDNDVWMSNAKKDGNVW